MNKNELISLKYEIDCEKMQKSTQDPYSVSAKNPSISRNGRKQQCELTRLNVFSRSKRQILARGRRGCDRRLGRAVVRLLPGAARAVAAVHQKHGRPLLVGGQERRAAPGRDRLRLRHQVGILKAHRRRFTHSFVRASPREGPTLCNRSAASFLYIFIRISRRRAVWYSASFSTRITGRIARACTGIYM